MSSWPKVSPKVISRNLVIRDDLDAHILEALPTTSRQPPPLLILLHGFPELAYSWRKVMIPLSDAGYHVVAPDQRGFGRTKSRREDGTVRFEDDLSPYRILNLVTDVIALVYRLGYQSAAAVVGHDFGSMVAGFAALMRPDVFKAVVMMSAPFSGPPALQLDGAQITRSLAQLANEQLAQLDPPRKNYTMYFSTPEANQDMMNAPQGLHAFLRAYYHVKSADWTHNQPHRLSSPTVSALAMMPHYYIMPLQETMPQCVGREAPSAQEVEQNKWLSEEELGVYTSEYTSTGFQGGLNWYRCVTDVRWLKDLLVFSGKRIEVPAMFIAGKKDWGVYQHPGAAEAMKDKFCENMRDEDFVLVDGAGHWVQQENAEAVVECLLRFVRRY